MCHSIEEQEKPETFDRVVVRPKDGQVKKGKPGRISRGVPEQAMLNCLVEARLHPTMTTTCLPAAERLDEARDVTGAVLRTWDKRV